MIWTSTSGITISSSERPNIVCGSIRLIQLRWRTASASAARAGAAISAGICAAGAANSLGLERIASAADGLQIARVARIGFDLAAQPGHLHIDIADVAAELRRFRQVLARDRLAGPRCEARQQPRLGSRQAHDLAGAEQLAAGEIEAKSAKAKGARHLVGDPAALEDVADSQHQFARLERLCQIVVGALFEA